MRLNKRQICFMGFIQNPPLAWLAVSLASPNFKNGSFCGKHEAWQVQTQDDSDYDVAVFLKDLNDRWAEADKIALAAMNVFDETGALIHAMPYREGAYQERTPLMHEVRREGIDL